MRRMDKSIAELYSMNTMGIDGRCESPRRLQTLDDAELF